MLVEWVILADKTTRIDAPVEMIFDLSPKFKDVSVRGRVTRREGEKPLKLGIEFVSPFSSGQKTIKDFLRRAYKN